MNVSTRFVYGQLRADEIAEHPEIDAQLEALERGDLAGLVSHMGNVLEDVTIPAFPVIRRIREDMMRYGAAGAMMSGSGPTVFGLFEDPHKAQEAADKLRKGSDAKQVYVTGFFGQQVKK